jgi:hypothetical protein
LALNEIKPTVTVDLTSEGAPHGISCALYLIPFVTQNPSCPGSSTINSEIIDVQSMSSMFKTCMNTLRSVFIHAHHMHMRQNTPPKKHVFAGQCWLTAIMQPTT